MEATMNFPTMQAMQQESLSRGGLQITVNAALQNRPIANATIRISYTGEPDQVIEEVQTDSLGQTPRSGAPDTPAGIQSGAPAESALFRIQPEHPRRGI